MRLSILAAFAILGITALDAPVFAEPAAAQNASAATDDALRRGRVAMEQNRLRDALDAFREASRLSPDSASAQTYRGTIAETLGEFDEALEAYRKAADADRTTEALTRVADLADRKGDAKLAIDIFRGIQSTTPSNVTAARLVRLLVEAGDRDGALAVARARGWLRDGADYCALPIADVDRVTLALLAMLVHPDRADCAVTAARELTDGGLPRLARMIFEVVIPRVTDRPSREWLERYRRARLPAHDVAPLAESLNVVAHRLENRSKLPDEAIVVYLKAMEADPKFSWPAANLGHLYLVRNDNARAYDRLKQAVEANPDHLRAQANLGVAAVRLRRYAEAIAAWKRVIELDPNDATAYSNTGRLLLQLGFRDEGAAVLGRAVALNPKLDADRELLNTLVNREEMSRELLERMELRRNLTALVPAIVALTEDMLFGKDDNERGREAVRRSITAEALDRLIHANLLVQFQQDHVAAVLAWQKSPLGTELTRLETDAFDVTEAVLLAHRERLKGAPSEADRLRLVDRILTLAKSAETGADAIMSVRRTVVRVMNPFLPENQRVSNDDLERGRTILLAQLRERNLAWGLYVYRDVPDVSLDRYIRYLETPAARWFRDLAGASLSDAIAIVCEDAIAETMKALATQPPART